MSSTDEHHWSHRLASCICTRPVGVIVIALILAAAAIVLTASRLDFQSDRNALINPDIPWNQRYIDWWEQFPNEADLLVIIDAGRPVPNFSLFVQMQYADAAADYLAQTLEADDAIESVFYGTRSDEWSPKAVRSLSLEQLRSELKNATRSKPLLESNDAASFIAALSALMQREAASLSSTADDSDTVRAINEFTQILVALERKLENGDRFPLDLSASDPDPWRPLRTTNQRFTFLRITPRTQADSLLAAEEAIAAVRRAIDAAMQAYQPAVDIGLTGVEVIESDETTVAATDSAIASCIAVVLISILLVFSFRSVVVPLLLVFALLTGVAWSFGFLTVGIGHLQVLSVVFVVILLGLGVDFGIHLVSSLEHVRHDYPDESGFSPALAHAFRRCGPGVIFGALTTSAAFFATTLTDFTGVAEMGLIACGGIVLCVIAMLTVLPALLRLFRKRLHQLRSPKDDDRADVFRAQWLAPIARHAKIVLIITGVTLVLAAASIRFVRFEYDLMALLPRGVESVRWQQRIARHSDQSIWYAVSIASSLEEAAERTRRFRALKSVADVGGIGMLTPDQADEKAALIDNAHQGLNAAIAHALDDSRPHMDAAASAQALQTQMLALRRQINTVQFMPGLSDSLQTSLMQATLPCIDALAFLNGNSEEERNQSVQQLNAELRDAQLAVAKRLEGLFDPAPLTTDDLPSALLHESIDRTNPDAPRYALYIYPNVPNDDPAASPLSEAFLPGFIAELRTVDPDVTGVPVQIYESGDLIKSSFLRIGIIALFAVLALTWLTFRSLIDALLALAPVAVGFALTFGLMGLTGVNLNPANIIVLPLMFGIGVDAGIHIMHRVRADPHDQPLGLAHGTGKAITLTALTTMIGFASMMVARHRGIASLGLVMTTGIGFTLLACWLVMPALLQMRSRWRQSLDPTP